MKPCYRFNVRLAQLDLNTIMDSTRKALLRLFQRGIFAAGIKRAGGGGIDLDHLVCFLVNDNKGPCLKMVELMNEHHPPVNEQSAGEQKYLSGRRSCGSGAAAP
jgi:hypothetical protein